MNIFFADFAVGNYHTVIVCPENQREKGEKIIKWVQRRAVQLDGTVTGEHGIGLKLRDGLAQEVGDEAINMMRKVSEKLSRNSLTLLTDAQQIKLALDPLRILNPDKVIRMEDGY